MELLNVFTAAVLILSLLVFTAYLFTVILFNVRAGKRYRVALAGRIHSLRLSKMLSTLGIDINEYLHRERSADIRRQMKSCAECENTETCDEQLENNANTIENISYCNNEQALKRLLVDDTETSRHPAD